MTDILGAIDASISLSRQIATVIQEYLDAGHTASNLRLFSGQGNLVRLNLIKQALSRDASGLDNGTRTELRRAATALQSQLQSALDNLRRNDPSTHGPGRLEWALWRSTLVSKAFEDINKHVDVLQGVVTLDSLMPNTVLLNPQHNPDRFRILYPITGYVLSDVIYRAEVCWSTTREQPSKAPALIESYRPNGEVNRRRAELIAQRLWWTRDNDAGNHDDGSRVGLLPCIGSYDYRVVFLLPKNTKDQQTLGRLLRDSTREKPSLDLRLSFALQLARAMLMVHSAGLVHCGLRIDTILFLTPVKGETLAAGANGVEAVQQSDNGINEPEPLKRRGTLKKRLTGVFGAGKDADKKEKNAPLQRQNSNKSSKKPNLFRRMSNRMGTSRVDVNQGPDVRDENTGEMQEIPGDDISDWTVDDIPAGFGSLYLMSWGTMTKRNNTIGDRERDWLLDMYRHPQQQGLMTGNCNVGHDIYSLGVCLLEIGLWKPLIEEGRTSSVPSRLARATGVTADAATYNAETVKKGLQDAAEKYLPTVMGEGYAKIVKACLTCLDGDTATKQWGVNFERTSREKACDAFRTKVISPLQNVHSAFETVWQDD